MHRHKRFDFPSERRKGNYRYYQRNKSSISDQQKNYRQTERNTILARRRARYLKNRISLKRYQPQEKRLEKESHIAELEKAEKEVEQKILELTMEYDVVRQKENELLDELMQQKKELSNRYWLNTIS